MKFNWYNVLPPGEVIKKEFGLSRIYTSLVLVITLGIAVFTVFFSVFPALLIAAFGILYWYYLAHAKHYAFTEKRIVLVDYFLGSNTNSIDYDQITDIQTEQSFVDMLLGLGTLTINTAGTHSYQTKLNYVDSPQNLKKILDQIRDGKLA